MHIFVLLYVNLNSAIDLSKTSVAHVKVLQSGLKNCLIQCNLNYYATVVTVLETVYLLCYVLFYLRA